MSAGISTLSSTRLIRLDRQAEEAEGKVVGQKIKANGQAALECSIFLCNTVNAVQQVQSSISTKYCRHWPPAGMQTQVMKDQMLCTIDYNAASVESMLVLNKLLNPSS